MFLYLMKVLKMNKLYFRNRFLKDSLSTFNIITIVKRVNMITNLHSRDKQAANLKIFRTINRFKPASKRKLLKTKKLWKLNTLCNKKSPTKMKYQSLTAIRQRGSSRPMLRALTTFVHLKDKNLSTTVQWFW